MTPAPACAPPQPATDRFGYVPATPGESARQLATQLAGHGLARVYVSALADLAVVSAPGVTVWVTHRAFSWTHHGQTGTWPTHNVPGAARRLAGLAHGQPASAVPGGE